MWDSGILMFQCYLFVQVVIHQNAAAVLANQYFLVLADLALALWRDHVEAATARIAQYWYNSQAIAVAIADTLVSAQQAWVYLFFCFV